MSGYNALAGTTARYIPVRFGERCPWSVLLSDEDQYDRCFRWMGQFGDVIQEAEDILGDHKAVIFDMAWIAHHAPCHDEPSPHRDLMVSWPESAEATANAL